MENENKKLGSEPAFPCLEYNENGLGNCITLTIGGEKQYIPFKEGISKRFYAACAAMQGIFAGLYANPLPVKTEDGKLIDTKELIERAYFAADELLKQENE